ncbi:MAG: hypothetical protein F9K28_10695 [Bacteroidetes bacterium]|nr:MAG: hypothetical protein F9K28_10695 [Bacteroidota bacterium]
MDTVAYEAPFLTNGNCTLGEAIHAANTNQPVDNCASGSAEEEDTILLAPEDGDVFETASLPPAYAARGGFLSAPFDVATQQVNTPTCDPVQDPSSLWCVTSQGTTEEAVTIEGDFYEIHPDNQNGKRLFHIYPNTTLTLKNVTLAGGRVDGNGGAILNEGTLIVEGTKLYRNRATENGGAIYNAASGHITVTKSAIYQNTALEKGGGIYDEGSTHADHSITETIIYNNAAPEGSSVFLESEGLVFDGNWWKFSQNDVGKLSSLSIIAPSTLTLPTVSEEIPAGAASLLTSDETSACFVRPLLVAYADALYPNGKRTVPAEDMLSVLTSQEDGLLVHYGPTLNSPMSREGNPVTLDNVTFDTFLDWNYRHVSVLYRVQYPLDTNAPAQVWYYVEDNAVGGEKNLRGWIAVQMDDKFYLEGAGIDGFNVELPNDANSDPCKGYIPTVNDPDDPEYDPDFTFTFYYDRETATKFAINQANTNAQGNIVGQYAVTSPINGQPNTTFTYSVLDNYNPQTGRTGSSVFISEVLWVGGYPTTLSFDGSFEVPVGSCTTRGSGNYKGWRYCHPPGGARGDGIDAWTQHEEIVGYYVDDARNDTGTVLLFDDIKLAHPITRQSVVPIQWADGTPIPDNQGGLVYDTPPTPNIHTWEEDWFFTTADINDYFDLEYVGSGIPSDSYLSTFYTWVSVKLASIQYGDYLYINTKYEDNCKDQQGNNILCGDTHGFFIVGWGPLEQCQDAIDTEFGFKMVKSGDGSDYPNTVFPDIASAYVNSVPYMVDFSGISNDKRRQTPKPRPFYCSYYDDLTTLAADGSYFRTDHAWFFFTMPDALVLPVNRMYTSPRG